MTTLALCFVAGAYGWLIWMLVQDQIRFTRTLNATTESLKKLHQLIRMQEQELGLLRGIVERMVRDG